MEMEMQLSSYMTHSCKLTSLNDFESKLEQISMKIFEKRRTTNASASFPLTNSFKIAKNELKLDQRDNETYIYDKTENKIRLNKPGSIKTSKSVTFAKQKSVTFADGIGLKLVSTRVLFDPESPPLKLRKVLKLMQSSASLSARSSSKSKRNNHHQSNMIEHSDDNEDFDDDYYCDNEYDDNDDCSCDELCPSSSSSSFLNCQTQPVSFSLQNITDNSTFYVDSYKCKWNSDCFQQPGVSPDFINNLNKNKINLDCIYSNGNKLNGTLRVLNLSYHKRVYLRYSLDKWNTFHDLNCDYLINNSLNQNHSNTDIFTFSLELTKEIIQHALKNTQNSMINIEFALCYEADSNHTYWDNNNDKNYQYNLSACQE